MGDSHVGLQARLMSQALRKITGALNASGTTAIFINQLREKIGVFFGSPETTTGGKALKFYASVRMDIRRIETLKEGTDAVGNRTRVKIVKNKMAPPFKQAEFDILYGVGISREGGLIDMGVEHGFVRKSGVLVHLRRRPARAGQGECARVPARQPRPGRGAGEEDQGEARGGRQARRPRRRRPCGRLLSPMADGIAHEEVARSAGAGGRRPARSGSDGRARRRAEEPPATGAAAAETEPDPESVARSIALRLLTGAPRSRAQLAEAMARRDVPEAVAERVLDRFTEVGLIDDAEYARILVRSRHADRGLARRALGVELRRKGIGDEHAAAALETVDGEQEEATARTLVRRRLAASRGLPVDVRTRRTVAMLGRKGYSGGLAHRLVREMLADEAAGAASGGSPWDAETSDGPPWDPDADDTDLAGFAEEG